VSFLLNVSDNRAIDRWRVGKNALGKLIAHGNRWPGGDTGWDVHHALFAREFSQVQGLAGQEPGYNSFRPEDVLQLS
jgi:hypothetical protein